MANDPVTDPKTPETAPVANDPGSPADAISATAPTADGPTGSGGTSIAAGPAPQVLFTPDPAAAPTTTAPAAKPGEELIGSWLSSHLHRTDVPYAGLVLVLTFLLGSFAAFNADIWMQLATGRLLSEGKYEFGVDPFAYTTQASDSRPAVEWINHSWLFAWASYLLYTIDSSGATLIVLKAIFVVGLGLLLLSMRPKNRHGWAGTLLVLLALVVMSPRFELQPVIVSIGFLGVTMFILVRAGVFADTAEGEAKGEGEAARPGLLWVLPALFALWVNFDSFFMLGPLTVLLSLIGLLVAKGLGHKPAVCVGRLGAVLAIGVVACVANPHHYRAAIRMPPELGYLLLHTGDFWPESVVAGGRAYMDFQSVQKSFNRTLSPLTAAFLTESGNGKNVAGIGFFVLLVVVLASFYFCKPTRVSTLLTRLVPTALFAILALMIARLIPFFAVVGTAVALLNIQEYLARRETQDPAFTEEHNLWANMARLATGFLLFGLFFLAWPGWINDPVGVFDGQRRVAWAIHENASLRNAVKYLEKMHKEEKLDRCFNLTPDVASYGAWYAPGVTFFLDQRFELFDRDVLLYNRLRLALAAEIQGKTPPADWRKEFTAHKIDHIIGSVSPGYPLVFELTRAAWSFPYEWSSIYADGKSFVLARKQQLKAPIADVAEQWRQQAFGKAEAAWQAPPPPLETDPSFWQLYAFGQSQPPLAAHEADTLLIYDRTVQVRPPWATPYLCAIHVANQVHAFGPNLCSRFSYMEEPRERLKFMQKDSKQWSLEKWVFTGAYRLVSRDDGDPAALIVGLRKTRQAIAENPNLGLGYRLLADDIEMISTMESRWAEVPQRQTGADTQFNLVNVRRFQYIAALKHFAIVNPEDQFAHYRLADCYQKENCLDLALVHFRESVKLLENVRNPTQELFNEKNRREEIVTKLQQEVERRLNDLELRTKDLNPLQKAFMATVRRDYDQEQPDEAGGSRILRDKGGMGLVGTAQKILREIPAGQLDAQGTDVLLKMSLRFALLTGDLAHMDSILNLPDVKKAEAYFGEFVFFLNAANGNYETADRILFDVDNAVEKHMAAQRKNNELGIQKLMVGLLSFSQPGCEHLVYSWYHGPILIPKSPVPNYYDTAGRALAEYYIPGADRRLLRAVFALEAGNTVNARKLFKETLDFVGPRMIYPDRKIAERYYGLIEP